MSTPIQIYPDAIYDDSRLHSALEVGAATLARARRDGRLRYSRQGKRILYLGTWVIDWLKVEALQKELADGR